MTPEQALNEYRYLFYVHEARAEERLEHEGIKPELLAYLSGIGESVR